MGLYYDHEKVRDEKLRAIAEKYGVPYKSKYDNYSWDKKRKYDNPIINVNVNVNCGCGCNQEKDRTTTIESPPTPPTTILPPSTPSPGFPTVPPTTPSQLILPDTPPSSP